MVNDSQYEINVDKEDLSFYTMQNDVKVSVIFKSFKITNTFP